MKKIGGWVLVLCMAVISTGVMSSANANSAPLIILSSDLAVFDANDTFIGFLQENGENLSINNIETGMLLSFDAYGNLMTPKVPIFFTRPGCPIGSGAWVPLNTDWRPQNQFNVYRFLFGLSVSILPYQVFNIQPNLGSCAVPTLVTTNPASAPTFDMTCLPASECPVPAATDAFIGLNIQIVELPFKTPLAQPLRTYSIFY